MSNKSSSKQTTRHCFVSFHLLHKDIHEQKVLLILLSTLLSLSLSFTNEKRQRKDGQMRNEIIFPFVEQQVLLAIYVVFLSIHPHPSVSAGWMDLFLSKYHSACDHQRTSSRSAIGEGTKKALTRTSHANCAMTMWVHEKPASACGNAKNARSLWWLVALGKLHSSTLLRNLFGCEIFAQKHHYFSHLHDNGISTESVVLRKSDVSRTMEVGRGISLKRSSERTTC